MKKRAVLQISAAIICFFFTTALVADSVQWELKHRIPIRGKNANLCQIVLAPHENGKTSDSVGIKISDRNDEQAFRDSVAQVIHEKGDSVLNDSHIYVTGVSMPYEKETFRRYQEVIKELGLESRGVKLHVISIPREKLATHIKSAFYRLLDRMKYTLPSFKRDYESPTMSEVVSGLISTTLIEIPNFISIYSTKSTLDANATAISNAAVLVLYTVFGKSMVNWLMRSQSNRENFLKQMSLAVPFVLSYNVFGQFGDVLQFLSTHTMMQTMLQFPGLATNFVFTQGLTTFLQTMFYTTVILGGIRSWQWKQQGTDNDKARVIANIAVLLPLSIDAYLLNVASTPTTPNFAIGPLSLNAGHAALAAITYGGYRFFKKWPDILDKGLVLQSKITGSN